MKASIKLDHQLVAIEGEHVVNAMHRSRRTST